MARSLVKVLFAFCFLQHYTCQANAIPRPQGLGMLQKRDDCPSYFGDTTFDNGGFQQGLDDWSFTQAQGSSRPDGKQEIEVDVKRPGDNSSLAAYFTGDVKGSTIGHNSGVLQREAFTCDEYDVWNVTFSLFLGEGKAITSKGYAPYLLIQFLDAHGVYTTGSNSWNFTENGIVDSTGTVYPLNQWNQFTEPFPYATVDHWELYFEYFVGQHFPYVKFAMDNVAVVPQ